MWIKRSVLFFCFLLTGLLLDAYWTQYSFRFAAECSESGNSVPASWPLFTVLTLIPATTSLIFGNNPAYVLTCLSVWVLYSLIHVYGLATDEPFGINCYRDVGAGGAVSFGLTLIFVALIITITLTFGTVRLARRWLHRALQKS